MSVLHRLRTLALLVAVPFWAATAVGQGDALTLQRQAQEQFQRIHATLKELQAARTTAEDPELQAEGRVIATGNRLIDEKRLEQRMEQARELINDQQYDEALERMRAIDDDLAALIDLLLNRDRDLQRLLEEIERLQAFKDRVDDLIEDQRREKDDAARSDALERHLRELEEAKRAVGELLEAQEHLREQTDQQGLSAPEPKARELSSRQTELRGEAERLAQKLEQIERDAARLDAEPAAEPKPTEPAAPGEQPPGEQPPGEQPPGEPAAGGPCSGSCQSAAGSMQQSAGKLGQNKPESSLEDQQDAIEKLRQAMDELERLSEEARRKLLSLPFEQQAAEQERTRVETDRLARDMEQSEQGDGESPPTQTPGKQNVQQAVPKQKAAAGSLKEYKPSKAKQDQQDALDDLEQAQKQLEDALAQLRQQLQDEVLRALEERFAAMLVKQKELSARTRAADRLSQESLTAAGTVPAEVARRCADLAAGELALGAEAGDALKLLEEDGSTAVFPVIVGELRADFDRVGERLHGNRCGEITQGIQQEIEQTLTELIDALRREIEMGEGQTPGQCDGQPPLVPMSAELKLVLGKQKRVNRRTKEYDAGVAAERRVTEEGKEQAVEISRKQAVVGDLMRRMAEKMNKEGGR